MPHSRFDNIHRLRLAAALLRKTASEATPGPWEFNCYDSGHSEYEMNCAVIDSEYGDAIVRMDYLGSRRYNEKYAQDDGVSDTYYIATMNPEVGLALAQWLDDAADWMGSPSTSNYDVQALIIASLILKNS